MAMFDFSNPQALAEQILAQAAQAGPAAIQQASTLQREDALRNQTRTQQLDDTETQRRFAAGQEVSALLAQLDPNDPANSEAIAKAQGFLTSMKINPTSLPVNAGDLGNITGSLGQRATQTAKADETRIAERNQSYDERKIKLQGTISENLQTGQLTWTADQNQLDRLQKQGIFDSTQAQELLITNLQQKFAKGERIDSQAFSKVMQDSGFVFSGTEAEKDRLYKTAMIQVEQTFTSDQNQLDRAQQMAILEIQNTYSTSERISRQEFDKALQDSGFDFQIREADKQRLYGKVMAEIDTNNQIKVDDNRARKLELQTAADSFKTSLNAYAGQMDDPYAQKATNDILQIAEEALGKDSLFMSQVNGAAASLGNKTAKLAIEKGELENVYTQSQIDLVTAQTLLTENNVTSTQISNATANYDLERKEVVDVKTDRSGAAADIFAAVNNGDVATFRLYQAVRLRPELYDTGTVEAVQSLSDKEWLSLETTLGLVVTDKGSTLTYNANVRDANLKSLGQAYASNDASMIQTSIANLAGNFDSYEQAQTWLNGLDDGQLDGITGVPGSAKSIKQLVLSSVSTKVAGRGREIAITNFDHVVSSVTSDPASVDNVVAYAVGEGLMSGESARRIAVGKQSIAAMGIKANIATALSGNTELTEQWKTDFVSAAVGSGMSETDAQMLASSFQSAKANGDSAKLLTLMTSPTLYDNNGKVTQVGGLANSDQWDTEFRTLMKKQGASDAVIDVLAKAYNKGAKKEELEYDLEIAKLIGGIPTQMTAEQMNAIRQQIDSRQNAALEKIKTEYSACINGVNVANDQFLDESQRCTPERFSSMKQELAIVTAATTELYDAQLGNSIGTYIAINPQTGFMEVTTAKLDEALEPQFVESFPPNPDKYNIDPLYTAAYDQEYAAFAKAFVAGKPYTFPNSLDTYQDIGSGKTIDPKGVSKRSDNPIIKWILESNDKLVQLVAQEVGLRGTSALLHGDYVQSVAQEVGLTTPTNFSPSLNEPMPGSEASGGATQSSSGAAYFAEQWAARGATVTESPGDVYQLSELRGSAAETLAGETVKGYGLVFGDGSSGVRVPNFFDVPVKVVSTGTGSSYGNHVVLEPVDGGEQIVIAHLANLDGLEKGSIVAPGQFLVTQGNTGQTNGGPHLYVSTYDDKKKEPSQVNGAISQFFR